MARFITVLGGRFALGVITAAALLAVLVVAVSALRGAEAGSGAPEVAAPLPVRTLEVVYADSVEIETAHPAIVQARRSSRLGFDAAGRIAAIAVDVGDRVEAGAVLARLDVRALEAALVAARADAQAARARARLADVTLTRRRTLVERGHVSAQALDQSQADYEAARAQAAAASAAADQIAVQIDLAMLTAPYEAVVTERHLDEGAVAGPGAPVITLVEDAALEVRVGLPARSARRLVEDRTYPVRIGGVTRPARLRTVTGVISPGARTVEAVLDLEAPHDVESGAVARLVLTSPLEQRGFWAPVSALAQGRRGLWSVYALVREGEAHRLEPRPVEMLHSEGDRVYLTGAVQAGERILAAGVHRVAPGQRVAPRDEG